ncbi:MAG: DsbA family protein [Oleiphilaceae bacterium]|nr:DsbA family protein [Oleiphilaceae bacterium]
MLILRKRIRSLCLCFVALFALSACSNDESTSANTLPEGAELERDYSPSMGPADAPVTIVEFLDPACEACRAFYPYVKEIMKRHPQDVRLVLRYAPFHQGSDTVVRMLEAASQQNVYVPVLEALLIQQQEWASHHAPNLDRAWEIAAAAGLNIEKTKAIIDSSEMNALIVQEGKDLRAFKVDKTPTFYVNGLALEKHSPDHLYQLVLDQLKSAE